MSKEPLLAETLAWLEKTGRQSVRDGMARYAIPSEHAFGIPVGTLRQRAKKLGRNHELALSLWKTGHYEARMLATFVDDPSLVTPEQMDAWCRDFESWAICDTACFQLFDRTPHAWKKLGVWAKSKDEFVRRAAFALLASLSVHDKKADDALFVRGLELVERANGERCEASASATRRCISRPWRCRSGSLPRRTRPHAGAARAPCASSRAQASPVACLA